MSNLQFIPSATAVNFRAYCDALNAALKMGLVELDQLCKEGGLNDLFTLQNQVMADAVLKSGEEQASYTRMTAIGQIVGAGTGLVAIGGGEISARRLQKQGASSITDVNVKKTTEGAGDMTKGAKVTTVKKEAEEIELEDIKDSSSQDSIDSSAQWKKQENTQLKNARKNEKNFDAQAANARQMGHTLANSLSGLSQGAFGIAAASHQVAQAHAEQLKTLANGGMDQANRAIQLLTTLLQLIKEQKDLAIQTQTAIAQAVHA